MITQRQRSSQVAIEVMDALIAELGESSEQQRLRRQAEALTRLVTPEDEFSVEQYLRDEVSRALAD
ncbi:hypothetical protein [Propionicimonas paludicola]|uniref:hypothetical protein n=1 Tax=Propionicimonas paludicola TaxID=185243 RepID=UPI00117A74A7|nr:hypothetical protein [Propionicimonas paludicola]